MKNHFELLLLPLLGLPLTTLKAQLPERTVPKGELQPYEGGFNGQPLPFELSGPILSPEGPTIPISNPHEGRVYDKTVAIAWSGANDWLQFMEALGTFGIAMQEADELHIFASNQAPPDRAEFTDPEEYQSAYRVSQLRNDFVRVKANPVLYPQFTRVCSKTPKSDKTCLAIC